MTLTVRTVIGWRSRLQEEAPARERNARKAAQPRKDSLVTAEKLRQIAAMRSQGKQWKEISAAVGLSRTTIWKYAPRD